jgi:succinate dehydrogenase/fumarate reductase flavoprotein subunit
MLIVKHADRLNKGIEALEQVRTEEVPYLWARDPHELRMVHEAESLLLTSILMLRSSLVREERRSELREDFPEQDNLNWLKWIRVKTKDDEFLFDTLDIPIDSYPVRSKREKFLHPAWKAANRTVKSPVS